MSRMADHTQPDRAGFVLLALILVAAVANLNLAVANVALPSIGQAFNASQTSLNLIAVGYSLGLAASVARRSSTSARWAILPPFGPDAKEMHML
jgi:MFS transporter, DHA2 family, multidrug resistance protein